MSRIVLGVDPGSRITGYGIIEVHGSRLQYVASGCIKPDAKDFLLRLGEIYSGVAELITQFAPDELAIEEVFVAANPNSALKLGQARGVAIAAAVARDLQVFEYAPRKVKRAVVGTGTAAKSQVQHMVQVLLSLSGEPSEDSADALAIGICHVNTALGEAKTEPNPESQHECIRVVSE